MTDSAVRLVGITKRFPGVVANDNVTFEVSKGEIHALLGENGAGKSTLMNILTGLYKPDAGYIELWGNRTTFRGPDEAIAQGIGVVFQHFKLVPTQTVAENVALGMRRPRFWLDLPRIERELTALGATLGFTIEPRRRINRLSVGEQQRVEIVKALYLGAKILALDEPTANLTPIESEGLFRALRALAAQGYAIIFISHKLHEVTALAHRATVLRGGKSVATIPITGAAGETEALAALMIGRDSEPAAPVSRTPIAASAAPILRVSGLSATGDSGSAALSDVHLEVAPGEIVALIGVAGNGQRELAETLVGLRPATNGTVELDGRRLTGLSPRAITALGVAFVPEDRLGVGLVPGLDLEANILLRNYWRPAFRIGPFVRWSRVRTDLATAVARYAIKVGDPSAPVRLLSGGNLQKVLLARELAAAPRVMIVANPTRGLDIGATAYVHAQLRAASEAGAALVVILEDLDEALALADRLLVMSGGRIVGECLPERSPANVHAIGLLMGGAVSKEATL